MASKDYLAEIESERHRVAVDGNGAVARIRVDDVDVEASHVWLDESGQNLLVLIGGRSFDFRIEQENEHLILTYSGRRYRGTVIDEHLADLKRRAGISDEQVGRLAIKSPMPGLVVKILVAPGDKVDKGQRLLVLEAMKMENDVKAPRAGKIAAISVDAGQPVNGGAELLAIE
jgi:biotin carboxyl carrier protein